MENQKKPIDRMQDDRYAYGRQMDYRGSGMIKGGNAMEEKFNRGGNQNLELEVGRKVEDWNAKRHDDLEFGRNSLPQNYHGRGDLKPTHNEFIPSRKPPTERPTDRKLEQDRDWTQRIPTFSETRVRDKGGFRGQNDDRILDPQNWKNDFTEFRMQDSTRE